MHDPNLAGDTVCAVDPADGHRRSGGSPKRKAESAPREEQAAKKLKTEGRAVWVYAKTVHSPGSSGGLAVLCLPKSVQEHINARSPGEYVQPDKETEWIGIPCLVVKGGGYYEGSYTDINEYCGFTEAGWKSFIGAKKKDLAFHDLPPAGEHQRKKKGPENPLGQTWCKWFEQPKSPTVVKARSLDGLEHMTRSRALCSASSSSEGVRMVDYEVWFDDSKSWYECLPKQFEAFKEYIASSTKGKFIPSLSSPRPPEDVIFSVIKEDNSAEVMIDE